MLDPGTEPETRTRQAKWWAEVRRMMRACIQCGTCSASCPNAQAMDMTPRRVWRCVQTGCREEIFASRTFSLCSACHYCSLRCPRGLAPADAMAVLKRIAAVRQLPRHRSGTLFYRDFLASVRRGGRVDEMQVMAAYFAHMRDPRRPLRYASLASKLASKGKLRLPRRLRGEDKLRGLFESVAAIEKDAADIQENGHGR